MKKHYVYRNNGERIFQKKESITKAKKSGMLKYKGWYSLKEVDFV